MKIKHIIYNSIVFPIKYHRVFIVSTILFLINAIITKYINSIEMGIHTPILMLIETIISLVILGFVVNIVYRAIAQENIKYKINIVSNFKEGFKDEILEAYYFLVTFILILISYSIIGLYFKDIINFYTIPQYTSNEYTIINMDNIINLFNPTIATKESIADIKITILLMIIITLIILVLYISFLFMSKIRLEETGSLKKSINIIYILKKIKLIGIKRYVIFILLMSFLIIILNIIIMILEEIAIIGIIIPSIIESFIILFSLKAFDMIYFDV